MHVEIGGLDSADVRDLLREHLAGMHANSPPGSVFALDLSGLKAKSVTFWTVREGSDLMGCGALKALDSQSGEIKSMRTAKIHLRKGVANHLMTFILNEARRRRYACLYLETGSSAAFIPATLLYEQFGFTRCGAFADYKDNDFSVFMKLEL
ncbi:MAG: GNAT family N-acetyltransferase [Phormidesmis sp.]